MANDLATTPPGAPPQAGEPAPRSTWVTDPWQARPPRAPVDPPPCADPVTASAGMPIAGASVQSPEGLPPHLVWTAEKWGWLTSPHPELPGPTQPRARAAGIADTTAEPVMLGKETPAAELDKLLHDSGWKPINGDTPNAPPR